MRPQPQQLLQQRPPHPNKQLLNLQMLPGRVNLEHWVAYPIVLF